MAISKTITNLERVGDEAEKIARMVQVVSCEDGGASRNLPLGARDLGRDGARAILRKALDAFARLDHRRGRAIVQGGRR